MVVHCTVYILNIIMMINQEKGKEVVSKYKGKGGYSAGESYFLFYLQTRFAIVEHYVNKFLPHFLIF